MQTTLSTYFGWKEFDHLWPKIANGILLKSKFYKKRGATFFYDITRKLGPLDFTQYRSKSSSF